MRDTQMQGRIDAAFEFLERVAAHPERFPDEAVLFLMDPREMASLITVERLRILRTLGTKAYPSLTALAKSLGRDVSRVRKDMLVLERLGLVALSKSGNRVRARPKATGLYIPLVAPGRKAARRSKLPG